MLTVSSRLPNLDISCGPVFPLRGCRAIFFLQRGGGSVSKRRVGVYIDYSNVYAGARDAFGLTREPGYRGNVNPLYLAKRVALQSPGTGAPPRRDTHELHLTKVFRGAPDPARDPRGALMEAKRAAQWEKWGCKVYRQTVNYKGDGTAEEKGVDVRLANTMLIDALRGEVDTVVLVSADKDFRYAILQILDETQVEVEVAIWQAIPGGTAVGRIEIRPERPEAAEVPFHPLDRTVFGRVEDKIDYRNMPVPEGWRGPVPDMQWRPSSNRR